MAWRLIVGGLLAITSVLLSSCINTYYIPNSNNVPLLTEKGNGRASIHYYSTSQDYVNSIPGVELQGSYAVGKHVGLMGSFLSAGRTLDVYSFHTTYGDLGVGYYATNNSKKLVFEVYGGYGLGSANNGFGGNITSSANHSKLFVQPVLGFKSTYFDAAISWRIASISHYGLKGSDQLPGISQLDFDLLRNKPTYTASEPALTLRGGVDALKLQLQLGWSIIPDQADGRSFGSIGLFLKLPLKRPAAP